jgi:myosin-7
MLDIVRIRKEGFPVHVPATVFVDKYRAVAGLMGHKLDSDPKTAARQILAFIKAPTTEWQIGLTKVLLAWLI